MAEYTVLLHPDVDEYLTSLDDKSERIIRDNLEYIEEDPYPGKGRGDKEKLVIQGTERYRMHISRSYTAFYDIYENKSEVRVVEVLPIDKAHKKYGYD